MTHNIYLYIFVMAGVSYAIRVLPLTLIKKPIENEFLKSFLYYVPYVTLAVRTEVICLSLFCPADPATSTFWMLSTAGSWLKN